MTNYLSLSSRLVHGLGRVKLGWFWIQPGLNPPASSGEQRNPKLVADVNWASQLLVWLGVGQFVNRWNLQNVVKKFKVSSKTTFFFIENYKIFARIFKFH